LFDALALSPDIISVLDAVDRTAAAAQKKAGASKLHAGQPVFTMVGPKRPRIHSCLSSMHDVTSINAVC